MHKNKILVVDDDLMILGLLSHMLEEEGYDVDTVSDGNIAIQYAQNKDYDVILTDIHMPYKTGLEVIQDLRMLGDQNNPRFIIMSRGRPPHGTTDNHILSSMREHGVDIFLSKPLNTQRLVSALEKEIEKKQLSITEENPSYLHPVSV